MYIPKYLILDDMPWYDLTQEGVNPQRGKLKKWSVVAFGGTTKKRTSTPPKATSKAVEKSTAFLFFRHC
jgi:hypothetical protein